MSGMWMPAWLYRYLPLIYLLFGLVMFFGFGDQLLGIVSGILLWSAAVLVWALRVYARRNSADRRQEEP